MSKDKRKSIEVVKGQRSGFCRQCHPESKDDKPWYHHDPIRAIYIRKPNEGFKRIGWYFERCGHIVIGEIPAVEKKPLTETEREDLMYPLSFAEDKW